MTSRLRIPAPIARLGGGLFVVLLGSLRCSAPTDPQPLQRFETCEALQLFLEDQILHPGVEQSFQTVGPVVGCNADEALAGAPVADRGEGEGEGDRQFTKTNTQEVNVDEPDFVKNNGDYIFVLRRGVMYILNAWPGSELSTLSETAISGNPFTMIFDDENDRVLVIASFFNNGKSQVLAKLFDVSDPTVPVELRSILVDGTFVDARAVGSEVLLVTQSQLNVNLQLSSEPFSDDANRAVIRAAGLDGLMPQVHDTIVGQDLSPRVSKAVACENTYAPSRTDGRSILLVHGIDTADETAALRSTGVVAGFSHVYGSVSSLYLASTEFADGGYFTPSFATTRLHKLNAFEGAGAAEYKGTGVFVGQIKDELSLDEGPDGRLRMVITDDSESGDLSQRTTSLLVIEESGTDLIEVARVDDIGRGESVESVRFIDDKAYVVTYPRELGDFVFDQSTGLPRIPFTDPLFVIDLADAKSPQLRGELPVDGYSAYIHPLDVDEDGISEHLLTVGVNTDAATGAFLDLSLIVFDVTDPDAPSVQHRVNFGGANAGSEALVERHAFTYFAAERTLALPVQTFDPQTFLLDSSALAVFRVDVGGAGFEDLGRIEQLPLYADMDSFDGEAGITVNTGPCASVRRSIMISEPGEAYVYAVSTAGITVASLLDEDLPTVANFRLGDVGDTACDVTGSPL